jgi:8-amino-7-oxononanoate synthase
MQTSIDVFAKVRGHEREALLSAAREANVLPYFHVLDSPAMPVVQMEGSERIMLGSNNYLGLTGDERVMAGAEDALHRYGTGLTGSRLLNGTIPLHLELESEIADWMGTEDAIVFTTGHQANLGTLGTLLGPSDTVIVDSGDHASILDGCLLSRAKMRPFRHNRLEKLEKMLERAQGDGGGVLVVVDGVFSMEGDIAPLGEITELCRRYGARLMVDEAHSVGSLGATGHGIEEHFGMCGAIDVKMGTLSKSVPSIGGYCAGSHDMVDFLRHYSRPFIFSAALPPSSSAAALEAFDVIEDEPWRVAKLHEQTDKYISGLKAQGWDTMFSSTCVVPIMIGDESKTMDLTRMLFDRGLFVCPIVHPAVPRGTDRLRTCLMATHTDEDIAQALDAFDFSGKALGLI